MSIQTNTGQVALACAGHVYAETSALATDAQLQAWVKATSLISLRPGGLPKQRQLAFPDGANLLFYTKTLATADGSLDEAVYGHTKGGVRKGNAAYNVWICDPGSQAWRDLHLAYLKQGGYEGADGGFNDSAGDYLYGLDGKPYAPPSYTELVPIDKWRSQVAAALLGWSQHDGRTLHCFNGLNPNSVKLYPPMIAMIENAFGSQSIELPSQAAWSKHARLVCDAQSAGFTPWVYAKMRSQAKATWDRWRGYMCATMLLLDKGSLLFELGGMEGTPPPYQSKEYASKAYRPGIGQPAETADDYLSYRQKDGTFKRRFARGLVTVDPARQTFKVGVG